MLCRDLISVKLGSIFNTKWNQLTKDGANPIVVDFLDPNEEDPQYAQVWSPLEESLLGQRARGVTSHPMAAGHECAEFEEAHRDQDAGVQ